GAVTLDGDRAHQAAAPRLTAVRETVRSEGVGWVWRRLRYRTPATSPGRAIHRSLRRALGALLAPVRRLRSARADLARAGVLYAFYDLQVVPITYDAAWFAVSADRARRRQGLDHVHFVIVPGKLDGMREERASYEAAVTRDMRVWRLHNVVIPIFG